MTFKGPSYTDPMPGQLLQLWCWALCWAAGTAVQLQRTHTGLWPQDLAWGVLALCVLVVWVGRPRASGASASSRPAGTAVALALALGVFALAFALTDWRAHQRLSHRLAPSLEGRDLVITGEVTRMPHAAAWGTRFEFAIDRHSRGPEGQALPPTVSLAWFEPHGHSAAPGATARVRAGERWQLPVRLRQPHGPRNPHGFDTELWLFENDLGASGTVRAGALRLAASSGAPIESARQALRDAIYRQVGDAQRAGIISALAIGDQAAIDRTHWDLFQVTGVAHLMSISGLHVTLFAWLAMVVIRIAWSGMARWGWPVSLWIPAPAASRWGGLMLAWSYALLAGWGVPAQRTVFMLAVMVLLRSLCCRWPALLMLTWAGVVVALLDPWALLQPGFWLSFVAVGLLMLSGDAAPAASGARQGVHRAAAALWSGLRVQCVASVGLAPLSMVFFQQVSVVGVLANVVAVPWVTWVLTPLCLAGAVWPGLWSAAELGVQALQHFLHLVSDWPAAQWTAAAAAPWAVLLGLAGAALAVWPGPPSLRLAGALMTLPLLWPQPWRPPWGYFELVAADVGQGTGVIVATQRHVLVYDTGPGVSADQNAAHKVLVPLLRARGESRIDRLVLSHRDADHVGGAATLLRKTQVVASSSSLTADHPLWPRLNAHSRCEAGQRWHWDGVQFDFLHPTAGDHAFAQSLWGTRLAPKPNALSCVLRITDQSGRAWLLTGDIEQAQEAALIQRWGEGLRVTGVLVPHHGSRTSSTPAFVAATAPEIAVVQAGYRSRFGHPAADVVARYHQHGVTVIRTDRCGAFTWPAGGCQRAAEPRYWQHRDSQQPSG